MIRYTLAALALAGSLLVSPIEATAQSATFTTNTINNNQANHPHDEWWDEVQFE